MLTIAEAMQPATYISQLDEQGNQINDLKSFYIAGNQVKVKQKYSVFYIYTIARYLHEILS